MLPAPRRAEAGFAQHCSCFLLGQPVMARQAGGERLGIGRAVLGRNRPEPVRDEHRPARAQEGMGLAQSRLVG